MIEKETEGIENLSDEMKEALAKAINEVAEEEKKEEEKRELKRKREEEAIPEVLRTLLDIPLEVSVEIGRTRMLLGDLLQITQGSTIELDKQENEPVEILVNGRHIARGEVILVGDKFGVRIIDIISPEERIKKLGKI
ncbi:Flagellar motor switch protein FliN [bacterium HR19]|nr:Flagellar motor switch protein FliN [bacterium HR19]